MIAAIVSEVDPDMGHYRARTSPDGMMTIAFTDLEGSTAMMERLGEQRWLELILSHNQLVRECVQSHSGDVVKSQGDGFMVAFASTSAALSCAVELQWALEAHNERNPEDPLLVRMGLHAGNIFQTEDQDFLGKTVVMAARITGRARGGEVLVSAACKQYTDSLGLWRYGAPSELTLKGLSADQRVYPLDWRATPLSG